MRKIIFIGLILLITGCQKTITTFIHEGEPLLKTDKDAYNDDETIELTIQNESASALYYQCHVPDGGGREYLILLYQEKQNNKWRTKFFIKNMFIEKQNRDMSQIKSKCIFSQIMRHFP